VEHDDRRFKLTYRTLDIRRRWKVGLLALLGRRAPDPETAWFVQYFAVAQLRFRWLRLVFGMAALAVSVWGYAQIHRLALQLVLLICLGLASLASLWTHRRAVRINKPIAQAPGAP
jgi:hypothetical protein